MHCGDGAERPSTSADSTGGPIISAYSTLGVHVCETDRRLQNLQQTPKMFSLPHLRWAHAHAIISVGDITRRDISHRDVTARDVMTANTERIGVGEVNHWLT